MEDRVRKDRPEKLPKLVAAGMDSRAYTAREAWQLFAIMSEFVEATERLNQVRPAVSIFGSARTPPDHPYFELAERIARLLSDSGFTVISGGGAGIMEAANRGAFYGKSPAVGLNIELPREQSGNRYQNISLSFRHFFTRKVMFAKVATAFIVLPGGYGTLDELFEALTLVQTGKTRQMPIILVHEPYWRGLIDWCRARLVEEGMIDATDIDLMQVCNEPKEVVDAIFAFYDKRGFEPSPAEREVMLNL